MAEVTKYSLEITGPALSFLYYAASFSNVSVFIFPLKQGASNGRLIYVLN